MAAMTHEEILEAVRQLPPEEQRALALEILNPISSFPPVRRDLPPAPDPRATSVMALRGIVKADTPLDDERLLDESRMERFS